MNNNCKSHLFQCFVLNVVTAHVYTFDIVEDVSMDHDDYL
jgi:hypothetical protein